MLSFSTILCSVLILFFGFFWFFSFYFFIDWRIQLPMGILYLFLSLFLSFIVWWGLENE